MNTIFELIFPLRSELLTSVRLAAGGMCALKGLDIEQTEDCKVCITESLLLLKHRGYSSASVRFFEGEKLSVRIEGMGEGEAEESAEDEISLALLSALLGEVGMTEKGGRLLAVSFEIGS